MAPRFLTLLLLVLGCSIAANAQACSTTVNQLIYGKVIVPVPGFDKAVEVLLFENTQKYIYAYTNGSGEYRFPSRVGPGRYEIVVRIDGFREFREKLDACDPAGHLLYNIFMDFEEPPIPLLVVDFSKELDETVDIAELRGRYPKDIIDEFVKARSDRLSGFFKTTDARLQKIVTAAPEFYEAHILLGANYIDLRNFRQAEVEFNRGLELKPSSAVPLLALGSLYLQEIQAATSPAPGDAGVIIPEDNIPLILDDARDVLERAVKIKPDAAFAHYLLGATYHKSGAYGRSEESYKKALALDTKLRWTRISLANLYLRLGRLKEVVEELDAYLKDYPTMLNRFEVQAMRKRIAKLLPAEKK